VGTASCQCRSRDRDGTDGHSGHGVAEAIRRAELYRVAGADGIYVEGLRSARELKRVGKALAGIPLATTMMEGGGVCPWLPPDEVKGYGFSMILYPTTVIFRAAKAIERALARLKAGKEMDEDDAFDREAFEEVVGMPEWAKIEGEKTSGPDPSVVQSKRFDELVGRVLSYIERAASGATRIEQFWLRDGHSAYPVFWEFAYVLAGPLGAEILIGSSSD
jgi:hypothetical protein